MAWQIAAAAAAPIIGGMIGHHQSRDDYERAKKYAQKAADQYDSITPPMYQDLDPVTLAQMQYAGDVDPSLLGQSEMAGINLDPAARQAQMEALQYMQNLANEGGMNDMDKARMAEIQQQADRRERGQREAIEMNMRQRGIGGSGLELMSKLSNQQASADRSNMEALQVNAEAQRRALQAMQQAGSMGSQVRGQDYQQAADRARAMDAIAQFNAQSQNQAGYANRDARQGVMNNNTGIQNQQIMQNQVGNVQYNNQNKAMTYGDKLQKASGVANAYGVQAKQAHLQGDRDASLWVKTGEGVGQGAASWGKYNQDKKNPQGGY